MSEAVEEKANRYLTEGRVKVWFAESTASEAIFDVIGSKTYVVCFALLKGWECDCPAQTECAHIVACKKILPQAKRPKEISFGETDDELTEFLNQY